jgi:hypothetical protein
MMPYILRVDLRPFKKLRFEHPDVLARGREVRPAVIQAVHTTQRNYIAAGSPTVGNPSRFPAWDHMVRFPLLWATGIDVAKKLEQTKDESPERTLDKTCVRLLREVFGDKGFNASSLQTLLKREADDHHFGQEEPPDAKRQLYEVVAQRWTKGITSPDSLGRYLGKLRNRAYGKPALVLKRVEGDQGVAYRVEAVT